MQLVAKGAPGFYAASNLPAGLGINASTGLISGMISAAAALSSPYFVSVTTSATNGHASSVQFTWTIADLTSALTAPADQTTARAQRRRCRSWQRIRMMTS